MVQKPTPLRNCVMLATAYTLHQKKRSTPIETYRIAEHIAEHGFPLEFLLAGELAQMETFAIPRISRLLHRTRQYENEGLKRLDDTKATMYGIFSNPPESAARKQMVAHLNWVHSHYDIHNDDNIYTLIRMFLHPIEWIDKWGRRALNETEKEALASELERIAEEMQIQNMPRGYHAMDAWQKTYRAENQRFHPDNQAVARGMIEGIKHHFPASLRPLVEPMVLVLLDNEQLVAALGFKPPGKLSRAWVHTLVRVWKHLSRYYNPWETKKFSEGWFMGYYPSYNGADYPNGFDYCKMGPKKLIHARNKTGRCPFH